MTPVESSRPCSVTANRITDVSTLNVSDYVLDEPTLAYKQEGKCRLVSCLCDLPHLQVVSSGVPCETGSSGATRAFSRIRIPQPCYAGRVSSIVRGVRSGSSNSILPGREVPFVC